MAVIIDRNKCTGCGKCIDVCPVNAIKMEDEKAVVSEECAECSVCIDECPSKAISLP